MLSISLGAKDFVQIGKDIKVYAKLSHGRIVLSIEAPKEIKILHSDLIDAE